MKKKYNVTIEETVAKTFEIEAENERESKEIAVNKYKSGEFMLSPGELTYKQIQVCDEKTTLIEWEEF